MGEVVVAGDTVGKVKAMFNEWGKRVKEAKPSQPIKLLGLGAVPQAGDHLRVVADEKAAKAIMADKERLVPLDQGSASKRLTLESVSGQIATGQNEVLECHSQGRCPRKHRGDQHLFREIGHRLGADKGQYNPCGHRQHQ